MQLSPHIEALLNDLSEFASFGDKNTAEAARRLAGALRPAVGLRYIDALNEASLELSAQLPSGHIEVRLTGQDPGLVFVADEDEETAPSDDDGLTARITLRLPEALKVAVEAAAGREGLSVNAWIVRALSRNTSERHRRGPGSRLTGFAQG
jgi:hypothetical protein